MAYNCVSSLRRLASTFLDYGILQARLCHLYAVLLSILSEELLALFACYLAILGCLSALLCFLLLEEFLYYLLAFLVRNLKFGTADGVLDCLSEIIDIKAVCAHTLELGSNAQSEGVTYFIHSVLILILV